MHSRLTKMVPWKRGRDFEPAGTAWALIDPSNSGAQSAVAQSAALARYDMILFLLGRHDFTTGFVTFNLSGRMPGSNRIEAPGNLADNPLRPIRSRLRTSRRFETGQQRSFEIGSRGYAQRFEFDTCGV
jgi:hypothetical protein